MFYHRSEAKQILNRFGPSNSMTRRARSICTRASSAHYHTLTYWQDSRRLITQTCVCSHAFSPCTSVSPEVTRLGNWSKQHVFLVLFLT